MPPETSLRVAFVCPFGLRPKATVSGRTLPMAAALSARGHQAAIFVPPWDDPEGSGRKSVPAGVPVTEVSLSGGPPAILARLLGEVRSFHPNIVHLVKPIGYPALVGQALHAARILGHRAALVLDSDDWEGAGGWNQSRLYPRWQKAVIARQERWCYRHAQAVTVASEALSTIAWSLGVDPDRVFAVPNALPHPLPPAAPEAIARIRDDLGLGTDTVLLYTRLAEFPPAWPVAFLAELQKLRPAARLLVVGEGLHGEHRALLTAAAEAGLAEALVYAGWVSSDRLSPYLQAADVAIVPFEDTLISRTKCSVKLLELMSLGVPVVASPVGENPRYLDYGYAGALGPPHLDAAAWAVQVAGLLENENSRKALGGVSARRLRERYLWRTAIEPVETAYETALRG